MSRRNRWFTRFTGDRAPASTNFHSFFAFLRRISWSERPVCQRRCRQEGKVCLGRSNVDKIVRCQLWQAEKGIRIHFEHRWHRKSAKFVNLGQEIRKPLDAGAAAFHRAMSQTSHAISWADFGSPLLGSTKPDTQSPALRMINPKKQDLSRYQAARAGKSCMRRKRIHSAVHKAVDRFLR